jgi:hypothetical protein
MKVLLSSSLLKKKKKERNKEKKLPGFLKKCIRLHSRVSDKATQ